MIGNRYRNSKLTCPLTCIFPEQGTWPGFHKIARTLACSEPWGRVPENQSSHQEGEDSPGLTFGNVDAFLVFQQMCLLVTTKGWASSASTIGTWAV